MCNRMAPGSLRNALLIVSTLAAMLAGIGTAAAQRDNPPGTQFQSQGERLESGRTANPSVFSRSASSPDVVPSTTHIRHHPNRPRRGPHRHGQ